jgi:hypothetical protein
LYRFHQWQANLRVLGVTEIKTVPYVPLSHPFVERLIGMERFVASVSTRKRTADDETKPVTAAAATTVPVFEKNAVSNPQ